MLAELREQHEIGEDDLMSEQPASIKRGTAYLYLSRIYGLVQAAAIEGDRAVLVIAPFLGLSADDHVALLELALDRLAAGHGP